MSSLFQLMWVWYDIICIVRYDMEIMRGVCCKLLRCRYVVCVCVCVCVCERERD